MPATAQHSMNPQATSAATITALLPTGERVVRELYEGDSVVIGSLEGCDVQLQLEGVASTHCIMGVDDGTIWLRDCYSPGGTFVDDRRVSQTQLQQSASVRIGSCELSLHVHGAPAETDELDLQRSPWRDEIDALGSPGPTSRAEPARAPASVQSDGTEAPRQPAPQPPAEPEREARINDLLGQLEQAHAEIGRLQGQLERRPHGDSFRLASTLAAEPDPLQEEMLELLRTEVNELQNELAQREAQLAELRDAAAPVSDGDVAQVSQEELETLVARLEQLLEELQRKDEHVELLEEMLRASDDANRAEQEERAQLEAWVRDIEQRVGQREAEWRANSEKLQQTIEEQAEHRRRLEQALEEALGGDRDTAVHEELTEALRKEIADLRVQLQTSEQQRKQLHDQLRSRSGGDDSLTREQQAEIARERAELARQRAQFDSLHRHHAAPAADAPDETQAAHEAPAHPEVPPTTPGGSDVDKRIRALRQHLAETGDEPAEERPATLTSRIASLWRRLEE